jgi:DNA-binding NarL/FixJ family response regulator
MTKIDSIRTIRSSAPSPKQTRVMVADPYPVIVNGLRKILEDDPRFQVVAEASTMSCFRKRVITQEPDVALVDWNLASLNLAVITELLQSQFHITSIIFLTVSDISREKQQMVRLGARGFLNKGCSARKIQDAVSGASKAARTVEDSLRDMRNSDRSQVTSSRGLAGQSIMLLTSRELELIPMVCKGLKNKEIALRLGIAETTVWHHLTSVFTKLKVEDRLELATFAYRYKLVHPHDGSLVLPILSSGLQGCSAPSQLGEARSQRPNTLQQFRSGSAPADGFMAPH